MFGNVPVPPFEANTPSDGPKQVFNLKDLSTKSVTLYPTRAHIIREINNVLLRPGSNEVEIYGLSPTVDEHSIQIEGQGAATIADMTVQLVPNRDIFEELYPEDSDSEEDSSDEEYHDSDDDEETVKKLVAHVKTMKLQLLEAVETQNSATERLWALDKFAKSVSAEHNSADDIHKLLKKYEEDRAAIFKVHSAATQAVAKMKKSIKRKEDEKEKAAKEGKKKKEKADKQKAKERRRKELQKGEKTKEAIYVKQERLRFFPKKVYKVTLLLEGASLDTPNSSRRGSVDEITLAQSPKVEAKELKHGDGEPSTQMPISLLLSYVTKEAGWTPRYDLKISSQQKTATIVYRTEFLNRTSETWKDAKLSFSTSQTSYQGLDDVVPFMHAWRIKLARYNNDQTAGLLSPEEAQQSRSGRPVVEFFNRAEVFGLDDNYVPAWQSKRSQHQQAPTKGGVFSNNSVQAPGGGLFGSSKANAPNVSMTASFGSHAPQAQMSSHSYGAEVHVNSIENQNLELSKGIQAARKSRRGPSLFGGLGGNKKESSPANNDLNMYDPTIEDTASTVGDQPENIEFEESSWEDSGLTATYDVPGTRTLSPSSETRRHKIASLNASKIHLSHISVPKLRSAAFLRAKIRNPSSSVTLLKGSAGVTLDGSFLGNMTLPRVSPGQVFDLPLGVDPAIHINYPKPSVHRSTQGIIFNKESAQVYTRSIWLNNTKAQPVELLVLDQIPVSEDERLRIVVTAPKGLAKEGDKVAAGVSAKEGASGNMEAKASSSSSSAWGNAVAKMKKNGEINWTVNLEKGQGCLLKLDYEARLPPAEKIVPA